MATTSAGEAAFIGALQAIILTVIGYVYQKWKNSRNNKNDND